MPKTTTILLRTADYETLQYSTDILALGEPCFATDSGILKIGNGSNDWASLPSIGAGDSLYVASDVTGITGASGINNIVQISQADYDALGTYDQNTIYFIV